MAYNGEERRRQCTDCISHSKHESEIQTLKTNQEKKEVEHNEMWKALDQRVPYSNFKWAFGIVITMIVVVSGINFTTSRMTSSTSTMAVQTVLETNHSVEKGLITVNAELKSLADRMAINEQTNREEHKYFRQAVLMMMQYMGDNGTGIDPMEELNKGRHDGG